MNEYKYFYYRLCVGQQELGEVDRVKWTRSEHESRDVGELRESIYERNRRSYCQHCDARNLSVYAKDTTVESYETEQPLAIDVSLNDSKIQGTPTALPLLVVVSAPTPLIPAANDAIDLVNDGAVANAKHLLNSLFDTTVADNLPNTFAKRQPFRAIRVFLTRRKKRLREFDGHYSNSQDRNSKCPPRGADRSPVNDPRALTPQQQEVAPPRITKVAIVRIEKEV
ncbi:unnamed protein product [Cylindrotheca closterium]|uniref:Uncharacterized protein n=1 Tax=Cylindrotheca closterium TaxID=2856 RepID=A0AAD2FSE1_9STRA|nr:unnamed protein product [Cylindrotheca closterium]